MEEVEGWGTCNGCGWRKAGGEEMVMHRDAWDRVKRVSEPRVIAYELENAKHRGNWVSIWYGYDVCGFDQTPVMQDEVKHRCPWHDKKQLGNEIEKEWWE